jgi:hypothetical protein
MVEHYIIQNHTTPDPQRIQRGSPGKRDKNYPGSTFHSIATSGMARYACEEAFEFGSLLVGDALFHWSLRLLRVHLRRCDFAVGRWLLMTFLGVGFSCGCTS